jgi:hypothetical protein
MTVQELIEKLKTFNPETKVVCSFIDPTDYIYKVSVGDIRLDSPYDENGFSGVDGSEMEDDLFDDDGNYIGEEVVTIDLGVV